MSNRRTVSSSFGSRWRSILVCAALAFSSAAARAERVIRVDLGGRWELTEAGSTEQTAATVPGCVHTDLMAAHAHIVLRCEGLDTIAAISINGKLVANTDNMFRTYEFDVRPLLVPGSNTMTVAFSPISKYIKNFISEAHGPASSVRGMANVRKAPYSNGWDFAPKLLTCGIYKKIELLAFNQGRLTRIATHTILEPLGKASLDIDAFAEHDSFQPLIKLSAEKWFCSSGPKNWTCMLLKSLVRSWLVTTVLM
jgi:hypothetical protein